VNTGGNTCLHLLLGAEPGLVEECLAMCRAGDQALLVAGGVALLCEAKVLARLRQACGEAVAALESDVLARGLAPLAEAAGVPCVGLREWVELTVRHPQSLSWR